MVEIIEFLIQSILIELTKFYYYSLKDKIIAISSDEERHCFECSAVISERKSIGLPRRDFMFPAVYKEMFPSCLYFHFLFFFGGCMRVCVLIFILEGWGGGGWLFQDYICNFCCVLNGF